METDECVAIEHQLGEVVVEYVDGHLPVLLGAKYTLIACREVLQIHTRCKDCVAAVIQMYRFRDTNGEGGEALHVFVVPVISSIPPACQGQSRRVRSGFVAVF